ncbi:hypothetical protein KA005_25460 [bacterium]|nr:hypothetical protein [bacterium]
MKKSRLKVSLLLVVALVAFAGCTRQGSAEQKSAFQQAVAIESQTQSIPARQAAYMKVVAMDPKSEYGKAAADRVAQLSREMESLLKR